MEYISHEDYKRMMENFSKGTPKQSLNEGLKKESFNDYEDDDQAFSEMLSDELTHLYKVGKITRQQYHDADDYLNDHGYELWTQSQEPQDFHALGYLLSQVGVDIEGIEEGNAFTAGLAKTKKGGEFKVGDKKFTDKTNYDASIKEDDDYSWEEADPYESDADYLEAVYEDLKSRKEKGVLSPEVFDKAIQYLWKNGFTLAQTDNTPQQVANAVIKKIGGLDEEWDSPYDGGADDLAAMASNAEAAKAKILGHVKNDIYKVQTPSGEVIELDFDLEKGDQVDDYAYEGTLYAEDDDYEYILPVALITKGGGSYSVEPYYKEFSAHPIKKKVDEYQFDQMYPDDPGPFEGKDVDNMIKEFLLKEDDVNWDRVDDEEAEENETDNGIEEGLNPAPFQATGPTIQTVEEEQSNLAHLTSEERDQLRQYVETIKTVKEQIKKMVGKTEMEEGGDNTNLVMKTSTVSEDGDDEDEDVEAPQAEMPDFITRQYEE